MPAIGGSLTWDTNLCVCDITTFVISLHWICTVWTCCQKRKQLRKVSFARSSSENNSFTGPHQACKSDCIASWVHELRKVQSDLQPMRKIFHVKNQRCCRTAHAASHLTALGSQWGKTSPKILQLQTDLNPGANVPVCHITAPENWKHDLRQVPLFSLTGSEVNCRISAAAVCDSEFCGDFHWIERWEKKKEHHK